MVMVKRDNLLALFLIIGAISLRVAATQSHKKGTRDSRTRSLVHIFPPRDENPEADFFAPTCTPSPPLTSRTPPGGGLGDEPADRYVRVPEEKGSTKPLSSIRAKPKVTKCREGAAPGVKKSKHKINASANNNISEVSGVIDLTINGDNVVKEGVDMLPIVGEESIVTGEGAANNYEAGLQNDTGVNSPGESKIQVFGSSSPSNHETNAIDSTIASAHGVIFEYEEDGSIAHIGDQDENSTPANHEGPLTLHYDDSGNFFTAEETPANANPSDVSFTPAAHGATAALKTFAIATVERSDVLETNGDKSDGLERRDKSGGSSRGYAALCVIFLVVLL